MNNVPIEKIQHVEVDNQSAKISVADNNCAIRTFAKGSLDDQRRSKYRFQAALLLLAMIAVVGSTRGRKAAAEAKSTDAILDNAERMLSEEPLFASRHLAMKPSGGTQSSFINPWRDPSWAGWGRVSVRKQR